MLMRVHMCDLRGQAIYYAHVQTYHHHMHVLTLYIYVRMLVLLYSCCQHHHHHGQSNFGDGVCLLGFHKCDGRQFADAVQQLDNSRVNKCLLLSIAKTLKQRK
eukprot:GHVS01030377.1.p2 GENE.GHVS01030377.1~~GHVS01030377.1.p2  ORF type:complete len:103 (+),score=8.22 GHVS01030377.1:710-1018(+)